MIYVKYSYKMLRYRSKSETKNVRNENAISNKRINAGSFVQGEFVSLFGKACQYQCAVKVCCGGAASMNVSVLVQYRCGLRVLHSLHVFLFITTYAETDENAFDPTG